MGRVLKNPTFPHVRHCLHQESQWEQTLWCWQSVSQPTAPRLLFVTFCKQHHPSAFSEPLRKQHVEAQSLPTAQQPTQHWVTAVRSSLLLSPQGCFSSAFPPGVYLVPSAFPETSPKQHCCKRAQSSACPERSRTERAISSPKHLQMLPCLSQRFLQLEAQITENLLCNTQLPPKSSAS